MIVWQLCYFCWNHLWSLRISFSNDNNNEDDGYILRINVVHRHLKHTTHFASKQTNRTKTKHLIWSPDVIYILYIWTATKNLSRDVYDDDDDDDDHSNMTREQVNRWCGWWWSNSKRIMYNDFFYFNQKKSRIIYFFPLNQPFFCFVLFDSIDNIDTQTEREKKRWKFCTKNQTKRFSTTKFMPQVNHHHPYVVFTTNKTTTSFKIKNKKNWR